MHYTIDQEIDETFATDQLRRALQDLYSYEDGRFGRIARVLVMFYGLDGNEPLTFARIGETLGITRDRARQLRDRGLRLLREGVHGNALESFVR